MNLPNDSRNTTPAKDLPGSLTDPVPSPFGDLLEMHGRYGLVMRALFRRLFLPIRFPEAQAENLEDLARKGQVIYVMQSASVLLYLFLNFWCLRLRIPLASYGNGIPAFALFQPLGKLLRALARAIPFLYRRKGSLFTSRYREYLRQGRHVVLFLRAPRFFKMRAQIQAREILENLLSICSNNPRPVFLVPVGILWGKRPEKLERSLLDIFLGARETPGLTRQVIFLLRYSRNSVVMTGQVIDLAEFMKTNQHLEKELLVKKIKWALHRELSLARIEVTGPTLKPRKYVIESILSHPALRALVRELARSEGMSFDKVMKQASRYADEIAADYSITYIQILERLLTWVWNNIYSGISVDQEGLRRVKEAARKSPLILLPSHKSHVDYLVLSYVFYHNDLPPPHIAAGVNLSFWPLGHIFRKGGAFFLRRTIRGQRLYAAVFSSYLKKLLRGGYVQEFFPEGTRSRTGKLLPPRLGMLSMEIDAFGEGVCDDLHLVPVAITYDRLVEESSHTRETGGARKEREKFWDLLKMPRFLRRKYGRVYIQFASPLSLREYLRARNLDLARMDTARRWKICEELALSTSYAINKVTTVTPVAVAATVLLNHAKRGISEAELLERSAFLLELIQGLGARTTPGLRSLRYAMEETLERFVDDRLIQKWEDPEGTLYTLDDSKRMHLDYYKNNILHFFLPFSIAGCIFRLHRCERLPEERLVEGIRFLQELFAREFIFPREEPVQSYWETVRRGPPSGQPLLASLENGQVRPAGGRELFYLAGLLDNFFESYYALFRSAQMRLKEPCDEKEFLKQTLESADRLYRRGDLQRRECRSVFAFRNALEWLVDHGCVQRTSGRGAQRLQLDPAGRERMEQVRKNLLRLLPGESSASETG
ncbi:MAG: 1-acyl-sn-glycerol-3-phosphate acyltransferase [bacterium]